MIHLLDNMICLYPIRLLLHPCFCRPIQLSFYSIHVNNPYHNNVISRQLLAVIPDYQDIYPVKHMNRSEVRQIVRMRSLFQVYQPIC